MNASRFCRSTRRSVPARALALTCSLGLIPAMAADATAISWDWQTRTASCPPKVTQSTKITVTLTGINDVIIDFGDGDRVLYQFRSKSSPVSVVPENPFTATQSARLGSPVGCTLDSVKAHLDAIPPAVARANNPNLTPPQPGGHSIPVEASVSAARSIPEVVTAENELADSRCTQFFNQFSSHPALLWLTRLEGSHSTTFNVNLEPNLNYDFTVQEYWKGKPTDGKMHIACGETDILTLSIGPLVSTLPARTYTSQSAPVPAGGTSTQSVLTVGGNSNLNVLGAALLNFHLPISALPRSTGIALSVGPVYKLGGSPGVSSLGLFAGASIHLYRSFFLTPGVHIGQFADFPTGFYPGAQIPNQFGALTPVTRTTAHFAIGITFKTTTFKSNSQNAGNANTPGTPPATGNQTVSGSKGGSE